MGLWDRAAGGIRRLWNGLSLSGQFLATGGLAVGLVMIVLATWANERIEFVVTRAAAEAGAILMQGFLQPYVQNMPSDGPMTREAEMRLDEALDVGDMVQRFVMLKIWSLDANLIYTSNKNIPPMEPVEEEVRTAASGRLARHFENLDEEVLGVAPEDNIPLLEVYAPLYRNGTNEIIAVGEFYQSAVGLVHDQEQTRLFTWGVVGATTLLMLSALFLIVARGSRTIARQRSTLEQNFKDARRLALQNDKLRKRAERISVAVSEANETFLSKLGADIHDGPIQKLSLLLLSLSYGRDGASQADRDLHIDEPSGDDAIALAKSLHAELRNISTGLILPEIESMSLVEVFHTAVSRYEALTNATVALGLGPMPMEASVAVKTCCYRVVQESLNNGFRHAKGSEQRVIASARNGVLRLVVADKGGGFPDERNARKRGGLGLAGMRNRVTALKGTLRIRSREGRGTVVFVSLPLG